MITVIRDGHPDVEGLDIAISRALLLEAAEGRGGESFRLHLPGRVVAFGKHDTLEAGYPTAVAAVRRAGFAAVERLAGGRAAVFHEETLAFSWTIPDPDPMSGVTARFTAIAELMARALRRIGIEPEIGEVPGEYCPGAYSVSHRGRLKLMGVGQRLGRSAAHVGGVVVVGGSDVVNAALKPAYRELGLGFDPTVTGAIRDVVQDVTMEDAEAAIIAELAGIGDLTEGHLEPSTMDRARGLVADHLPAPT